MKKRDNRDSIRKRETFRIFCTIITNAKRGVTIGDDCQKTFYIPEMYFKL